MYDTGKIGVGLLLFAGLLGAPVWYTHAHGKLDYRLELQKPASEKSCVESTDFMKARHMELLDEWRSDVVRGGQRFYVGSGGKRYLMSLSSGCLQCHVEPAKFCNRCHEYAGAAPYCWDCHQQPKGSGTLASVRLGSAQ